MKKMHVISMVVLSIGLCPLFVGRSQQFRTQTNIVVSVPPVVWQGTNAVLIASQLLNLTNGDGTFIVPPGLFTNKSSSVFVHVECGSNGLQSIRARIL
jgi:hypothetical protein